MPFLLNDRDVTSDLTGVQSVLIVPCRFCPAASLAVRSKAPYIRFFRSLVKTPAYEAYVRAWQTRLVRAGIRTGMFVSRLPNQFVLCMWSAGRREDLARRAAGYDVVMVLGCDAAVETVQSSMGPNGCRVIPGMEVEGIMSVVPSVRFPFTVWLDMRSVTRVLQPPSGERRAPTPNEIV